MKGLKIIPVFLGLLGCCYLGLLFIESNRTEVMLTLGRYQSDTMPLGFAILTSLCLGMVLSAILCSIELASLYWQNRHLRKRVNHLQKQISSLEGLAQESSHAALPLTEEAAEENDPKAGLSASNRSEQL